MDKFDVIVLGAGPGGYQAAIRSAQYGLKTALIEERELGGTCLNRGCIPTKAMLNASELYQECLQAKKFGITAENVSFDFAAIAARRDKIIGQLRSGIKNLEKANGVTVIEGRGRLHSARSVEVGSEIYEADRIILATGSRPFLPPIDGARDGQTATSDDFLSWTELPESVILIGGGVIGIEFAFMLASFGKKVTILEMAPSILPGVDSEITKLLLRKLKRLKVEIKTDAAVQKIVNTTEGETTKAVVSYEENGTLQEIAAKKCVVCAGRRGNIEDLGLEEVGVTTERGRILVNESLQTNIPSILAIGDIASRVQLAHAASAQGLAAAAFCAGKPADYSAEIIPACVYTSPEIAYVGVTEEAALAAGRPIRVGRFHLPSNGKAMVMGADTGLVKIVADAETEKILGAQILGPRATDMIAEIAVLMKCGGTLADLAGTIHPHPTLSEALMETAEDALGLCCHAAPKKAED